MLDISVSYLSEIESGQHSVDFEKIEKLAEIIGVEPYQLFKAAKNVDLPRRVDMNINKK